MLPGTFGVIVLIACIILLASGWGRSTCMTAQCKPSWLLIVMILDVSLSPYTIHGVVVQSISLSGAFIPFFLVLYSLCLQPTWLKRLFLPIKGVVIGSGAAGAMIWANQVSGVMSWELYWYAAAIIMGIQYVVGKTLLDRLVGAVVAILTASIWMDVCILYVPPEHLEIGDAGTQDRMAAVLVGIWMIHAMVHSFRSMFTTRSFAFPIHRSKRT